LFLVFGGAIAALALLVFQPHKYNPPQNVFRDQNTKSSQTKLAILDGENSPLNSPDEKQNFATTYDDFLPKIPITNLDQPNIINGININQFHISEPSPEDNDFNSLSTPVSLPFIHTDPTNTVPIDLPTFSEGVWKMPFRPGTRIQVHQGYNGQFSHQGKYALDMPSTEPLDIVAARSGTIIEIANGGKWNNWCNSWAKCNSLGQIWDGNHIFIRHSDGTVAVYLHFRPGTISPNLHVGSTVNQGDFLGTMGSTGYTCLTPACTEPDNHLHFEVDTPDRKGTIPTQFVECANKIVNSCDQNGWFVQGNYYTSD
jgi:murein DD-endopeptidase MepM/ murein hydrolase activator NlpD